MDDRDFSRRIHALGVALAVVALATTARLFWVQIIRHSHYQALASSQQLRKYEVLPERGTIYLNDRGSLYPVAINQDLRRLYADPRYITNPEATAASLSPVIHESVAKLVPALKTRNTAYVVLKHGLNSDTAKQIDNLDLAGIGLQPEPIRAYPEGSLAAQVLGFVNADGDGQYGVEQSLNSQLAGQKGLLKATTDVRGIPIATSDSYQVPPQPGDNVVLTIDRNIQSKVEDLLAQNVRKYQAKSASAVIMDPNSGAILAMADYPTYNPANFSKVNNYSVFSNRVVTDAYEPGSVFKVLTMSTGLDNGSVTPETRFNNTGSVTVDGKKITNVHGIFNGSHSMTDVVVQSINTGAVYVLQQLGGGTINPQGKQVLYDYFTKHFLLGEPTGVDLPNEASGVIHPPQGSADIDYANATFGQGLTATMIQIVDDYAAIANGGTLYRPYVVDAVISPDGQVTKTTPVVRARDVLKVLTITQMKTMMRLEVIKGGGFPTNLPGYGIGGKTGTAQIPNPAGGYYEGREIGSFGGIITANKPAFVMFVRIDEPHGTLTGFAGSGAAAPLFADIARWLVNYRGIAPHG